MRCRGRKWRVAEAHIVLRCVYHRANGTVKLRAEAINMAGVGDAAFSSLVFLTQQRDEREKVNNP